jgi:hypothetical protein
LTLAPSKIILIEGLRPVRDGIPARVVMDITGHRTRSVFENHNITSDAGIRELARKQEAGVMARNNGVGYNLVTFPHQTAADENPQESSKGLTGLDKKVVAGHRIELWTQGFSVLCSTD